MQEGYMYNMENMDTLDIFLFLYGGVGYTPNHLWISQWTGESEENQWEDLSFVLNGSVITRVLLTHTVTENPENRLLPKESLDVYRF